MSDFAIRAHQLGKRYRIGAAAKRHDSLRDALTSAISAPIRNFRELRGDRVTDGDDAPGVHWALRDVSFELKHGEVLGVIGRNGAGKSTLLKVLSRITEPTRGRAVMTGRVGSLLEVGTGFHPDLTGRENVYLNGAILGMDRSYVDRRFDEIVEFAGVAKFIDTAVKRYSSGMYLRLAFAVAAHLEPDILIVDEVLAVGDAQFQKKCLGKMSSVSKEGRTVLFVSHNLTAVRTLCTRAILLRQGRLIADESANEAVAQYVAEVNQNELEREYPDVARAPQNTSAVIRRVALRTEQSSESDQLDTATPLAVEIDYETKSDDAVVGFTLLVHDAENNAVFISISNREPRFYGRPMAKGSYRTVCHIPANLLNAGWFTIGLNMFGSNFSDNRFTHEILRFEVQDSQEIRGDYFGPYWGAVRPALEWTTEAELAGERRAG
jgi:lipopolysaccharide transport system ATP-binding protein